MSENELAVLARNGDNSAFAALVCAYQSPIYNLCYRMLGDSAEAEDAAQESFLKAYSQLDAVRQRASFQELALCHRQPSLHRQAAAPANTLAGH